MRTATIMNTVLLSHPDARIAILCINRPAVKNALNQDVRRQVAEHFTALGLNPDIRCISTPASTGS
jgi:enoyl-CoA hydratase